MSTYPTTADLAAFRARIPYSPGGDPWDVPDDGGAWPWEIDDGIGFRVSSIRDERDVWRLPASALVSTRREASAMRSRAFEAQEDNDRSRPVGLVMHPASPSWLWELRYGCPGW